MRVQKEAYTEMYTGGKQVLALIEELKEIIATTPTKREYAKRIRSWVTMCYRVDADGLTKSKGGICALWLKHPLKAIDYMRSIADGPGRFERISPIKEFGPKNLRYRTYATPIPEESDSLGR